MIQLIGAASKWVHVLTKTAIRWRKIIRIWKQVAANENPKSESGGRSETGCETIRDVPITPAATGRRLHGYGRTHGVELQLSTSTRDGFHYFINNVNIGGLGFDNENWRNRETVSAGREFMLLKGSRRQSIYDTCIYPFYPALLSPRIAVNFTLPPAGTKLIESRTNVLISRGKGKKWGTREIKNKRGFVFTLSIP